MKWETVNVEQHPFAAIPLVIHAGRPIPEGAQRIENTHSRSDPQTIQIINHRKIHTDTKALCILSDQKKARLIVPDLYL